MLFTVNIINRLKKASLIKAKLKRHCIFSPRLNNHRRYNADPNTKTTYKHFNQADVHCKQGILYLHNKRKGYDITNDSRRIKASWPFLSISKMYFFVFLSFRSKFYNKTTMR